MLDKLAEAVSENAHFARENAEAIRDLQRRGQGTGHPILGTSQASQWVVKLAFGLLATATITSIVTVVVRR